MSKISAGEYRPPWLDLLLAMNIVRRPRLSSLGGVKGLLAMRRELVLVR
jgi:hypothetical protein